jgi:hypothetical protein
MRAAIGKPVFHALTYPVDVGLRPTLKSEVQTRHNRFHRPDDIPVILLALADVGRVEMPLGHTSGHRDQHTLDVRALLHGLLGERYAAAAVVRLDPNLFQPKPEEEGDSRMTGLVMAQEVKFAG